MNLSEELTHDPDAAAELLDEAGWTRSKDGTELVLDACGRSSRPPPT